jgi:hypothetical protein
MSRGHIRKRGRVSFELKFELGLDTAGRRQIRYASFEGTKRAAEVELARLIAQHAAGESIDPSRTTVAEFLAHWDHDWASLNVSPKTLERYRQIVRLYIVPRIGGLKIQKLRPVHLAKLYADLTRAGGQDGGSLSAGSVSYVHRVLQPCPWPCHDLGARRPECCGRRRAAAGIERRRNQHPQRTPDPRPARAS